MSDLRRRLIVLLIYRIGLPALILMSFVIPARAEDWAFRRSYFSHMPPADAPPFPVPVSPSAYRPAHYRHGFGINTGYRFNNYVIQNGNRVDRTWYREGWVEFYPQRP